MKVEGVKITWVSRDEAFDQRDRPGFMPVEMYGTITIERNEVGSITRKCRTPMRPTRIPGLYEFEVICLERIFIVEPE